MKPGMPKPSSKQQQSLQIEALFDRQLLWLAILLLITGLLMVTSASLVEGASLTQDPLYFAKRHAAFLLLALLVASVALNISMATWQKNSGTMLLISIVLLLSVLFIGKSVNGSTRWLSFGYINLQPAELIKFTLLVYLASYLTRKQQEIKHHFKGFIKPILVFFIIALLLLAQPDLGTIIAMFITTISMLFLAGAKLGQFIGLILAGVAAIGVLIIISPYRLYRITSFLDPWQDPFGSGYQLTQSLMALGRGGLFGEGLGNSIQKLSYLPEAHTDFILSVLGEELGFTGVALVLLLQLLLVIRGFTIARRNFLVNLTFAGFLAAGITVLFSFQTIINVGVALGIAPTKGLTLPLMSYGGSSLLIMTVAVALLLRIDYEWRLTNTQALLVQQHGAKK